MSKELYTKFSDWAHSLEFPVGISDPGTIYYAENYIDLHKILAKLETKIIESYKLDWLNRNFDSSDILFEYMQHPKYAEKMQKVFSATPEELGEAAVRAAKNKDLGILNPLFLLFLVWYGSMDERIKSCPIKLIKFEKIDE